MPRQRRIVSNGSFHNLSGIAQSTAQGAKGIFVRFLLVAVGLNILVGLAVIIYDVADTLSATREHLTRTGQLLTGLTLRMRQDLREPDEQVVERAAALLNVPLALIDRSGELRYGSRPELAAALPQVYPGGQPTIGATFAISDELGPLSGAWLLSPFSDENDLLLVVPRSPEEEGIAEYMTIAAGLIGLGLALSFGIMLVAANWMLHRPLTSLVGQLTDALAADVERRRRAEERAVTARLEAEGHLAFRENLLNSSESVGIIATDPEGMIQIFNHAAEAILGHEAGELVGKVSYEELRQRSLGKPPGSLLLMHAAEDEEFWLDRDGRGHLLEQQHNDIHDAEGNLRGRLITFLDVTERRRLQAELQLNELQLIQSAKMATLGEMATGIAHEINQPLNNIGLLTARITRRLSKLALEQEARGFVQDKLTKVQEQLERAGLIIDHLRTFGRPRAKTLDAVALQVPVQGVTAFMGEQLRLHDIGLEIAVPENLPAVVADEPQLEQVLMNLLINARDALDELPAERQKQIRITAACCPLDGDGAGVCLTVTDNGPGIPAELQDRVFEPFFSTKEIGKGTGLGLSISYGLIKEFGGTLEVSSQPGEGTTFRVRLRQAQEESSTADDCQTEDPAG